MPYLFLECKKDPVVPPGLTDKQGELCDDITIKSFDAGHWLLEEDPDGAWRAVSEWLVARL